ncbi:MAG: lysophospholipid acyltransferase family protein [Gemmatimonas sp.]|jgi:1-acyl-sn-glycerol-3-phosphate acyltransferase|uniref:lysophospholipid acyltransferase family protein n=1 Tax=Gemmatimonas sp. TaxID=1962908 RepID=UPI00391F419A|nr:1-acyl-sn-glycerol-3-phosphate acyltransferase [Gemmatimonadota bacterium]
MFRTALTFLALLVGTVVFGGLVLLAKLFGVRKAPDSVYEKAPRWWAAWLLRAAGVKVVLHGDDGLAARAPRVYIANHVSWFDIPAMIEALPHYGFVAKRELEQIPLFGAAAREVGVIYIDRENRKAAFGAYEDAARKIREGNPVLVYPEGTRGHEYALRPFKKGPFVLAIGSGAPIVPVVIHGTIAVNPRGEFRASPGTVHVHLLEPIPTAGLTYDDRNTLADQVRERMAACLRTQYGVDSASASPDLAESRSRAVIAPTSA